MTHRKTTTAGSQETQTCERGMTMGSGRICFGKLGDHPVVDFAAQELARYLKQMDAELSVTVFQADGITQALSGIVWIGIDPELYHAVPEVADPSVDDAIVISVENGTGYITGTNERSVLLAAYRFLKELGCAWVRPGPEGERIPKKKIAAHRIHVREKAVLYYVAKMGSLWSVRMLYLPEGLELEFFQVESGYILKPPEWTRSAPEWSG